MPDSREAGLPFTVTMTSSSARPRMRAARFAVGGGTARGRLRVGPKRTVKLTWPVLSLAHGYLLFTR
ncbi:unannotated protein [freshwater metagenome]|uniref:Unannotated protein n=1 Tax=freshwater metagenome TaxID=449393 RepID=A0A6J7A4R1_9ZZZZ